MNLNNPKTLDEAIEIIKEICPEHEETNTRKAEAMVLCAVKDLERSKEWETFWEKEANEALKKFQTTVASIPKWIPVTERLPECDLGAEVGNIEWISCGMVHSGCFGRGGKYGDAYFRTWTDAGEGMDAKDADYWRAVTLPEPPKEE